MTAYLIRTLAELGFVTQTSFYWNTHNAVGCCENAFSFLSSTFLSFVCLRVWTQCMCSCETVPKIQPMLLRFCWARCWLPLCQPFHWITMSIAGESQQLGMLFPGGPCVSFWDVYGNLALVVLNISCCCQAVALGFHIGVWMFSFLNKQRALGG